MEQQTQQRKAPPDLPRYRCHKEVCAFKIGSVITPLEGKYLLAPEGSGPAVEVGTGYLQKHKPEIGGYYVRYADGYESFSPAKAFEEGYSPIPEEIDDAWNRLARAEPAGIDVGEAQVQRSVPYSPEWIRELVSHHAPTQPHEAAYTSIRAATAVMIQAIIRKCPACADRTAAIRKVREAMMTANALIALNGLV
ncbi:MAG: hypothetical protein ABSF25_16820 [Bryobacteraceae bacterium]